MHIPPTVTGLALLAAALAPFQDGASPAKTANEVERALAQRVDEKRAVAAVHSLVDLGPRMGGTASGAEAAKWLKARFVAAGVPAEIVEDEEQWCHSESAWSVVAHVDGVNEPYVLERAWPYGFSPSAEGEVRLSLEAEDGTARLLERFGRRGPSREAQPAVVLVDGATTLDGTYPQVRSQRRGNENTYPVFGISKPEGAFLREHLAAGKEIRLEFSLTAEIKKAKPSTVIARIAPVEGAKPGYLLYCAHGDSDAGGPGADDNASGEAVVLEIATAWAAAIAAGETPPPAREVRFAVWGSEIASTRTYMTQRLDDGSPLLGVLNYDQAGYGSGANQFNIEPDDIEANHGLIHVLLGVLADHGKTEGFPERWATNKSLGGTDSYVFSGSKLFREEGRPALTLFTSAWDKPDEQKRTEGMPGESWQERDKVNVDYDNYYHSAGDTPENTVDKEPFNMGWCARIGMLGGRRWLAGLEDRAQRRAAGIVAVGALLTALAAGVFLGIRLFDVEPEAPSGSSASDGVELQGEGTSLGGPLDHAQGVDASEPTERVAQVEIEPTNPDLRLRGVVFDELGRPIEGALVVAQRKPSAAYSMLDLEYNQVKLPTDSVRTDAEGRFALTVPPARPLELEVSAPGHAPDRRRGVYGGEFLTIQLSLAAILEGRIVALEGRTPIEGVVLEGYVDHAKVIDAQTSADGQFYFDDLPAGLLNFQIQPPFHEAPAWHSIELEAGRRIRRDYELEAGVTISGTVTDARTGAPIVGAEVGEGWFYQKTVTTNGEGRYELRGFGGPGVYDVNVRAEGYGGKAHEFPYNDMPTEATTLDFALDPAHRAHGLVHGSDGEPLGDVYVAGVASDWVGGNQRTDWQGTRSRSDGTFTITSLNPTMRHQLMLQKEGHGMVIYDFPAIEQESPDLDLGTFRMPKPATLSGVCVSESGAFIPNAHVQLMGSNSDRRRLDPDENVEIDGSYTRERDSRSDSMGRFHFNDLSPGHYTLEAWLQGTRDPQKQSFTITEGQQLAGIEVVLPVGLSIRGVAVAPDGTPLPDIYVEAEALDGEGRSATARTGPGGRFEIVGLSAGEYSLKANPHSYNWSEQRDAFVAVTIKPVTAGQEADAHIVLKEVAHIAGVVLHADGTPAPRMRVRAFDAATDEALGNTNCDAEGRFEMKVPAGCTATLACGSLQAQEGEFGYLEIEGAREVMLPSVRAGSQDVELRLFD